MTEVSIADAMDGAKYVRAKEVGQIEYLQVWYGGTQVRVFGNYEGLSEGMEEVGIWTASDHNGEPYEWERYAQMMTSRFEEIEREGER